jgi:hypothetical protein
LRRLTAEVERRSAAAQGTSGVLTRKQIACIQASVWHDAGAVRADRIRISFARTTGRCGLDYVTCPKTWRHTFATLLQDANVDPLTRQLTLGHAPAADPAGALGMTAIYTHTRPETQRREIERALRLWPKTLNLAQAWTQGANQYEQRYPTPGSEGSQSA